MIIQVATALQLKADIGSRHELYWLQDGEHKARMSVFEVVSDDAIDVQVALGTEYRVEPFEDNRDLSFGQEIAQRGKVKSNIAQPECINNVANMIYNIGNSTQVMLPLVAYMPVFHSTNLGAKGPWINIPGTAQSTIQVNPLSGNYLQPGIRSYQLFILTLIA